MCDSKRIFPVDPSTEHNEARIRRFNHGDQDSLGELIHACQSRVLQTAYRFLGSWDAAEDIVQEAFLRAYQAAPEYRAHAAITTWLYRLTVNLCLDHRRRAVRERRLHRRFADERVADESREIDRQERGARVRKAVMALPDRQRLVVILHRFDGLTHHDIEQVTGWSASAIESCLVRAYAALRKSLQKANS